MKYLGTFVTLFFTILSVLYSQSISDEEISRRIKGYKGDIRGPYKEIRWYCKDGIIIPPQERCPEPGGVQRARHKDEVYALSLSNHVYLGQILAATPFFDFWDEINNQSRLKQYQLEKYLREIDNGWVLRKAQYYRGAFQAEDESNWGLNFYHWILAEDKLIEENYFLLRQSIKDVPHLGDSNLTQQIRTVSKVISEKYPTFLDLRVKIHGQPEESDLKKVIQFRDSHLQKLDKELLNLFDKLIADMNVLYSPVDLSSLNKYLDQLPTNSVFKKNVVAGISEYSLTKPGQEKIAALSRILYALRKGILSVDAPKARLAVFDLSITLEKLLMKELSGYSMLSIKDKLETMNSLGMASAGCGYMELGDWGKVSPLVGIPGEKELSLNQIQDFFETGRRMTEWGIGMFRAHYDEVLDLYGGREPFQMVPTVNFTR